jgi:Sulfatase
VSLADRPRRWELLAFLELAGLCGLAVTQPLLDIIGRSPDVLLLERVGTVDMVLLAAAVALLPPVLLWAVGAVGGLAGWGWRQAAHVAVVAVLLVALAVQVGKHVTTVRGLPLAAAAAVAGLVATAVYLRFGLLGLVMRVASVGPLLSVVLFLFVSPASALVWPQRVAVPPALAVRDARRPPIVVFALDELPLSSLLDERGRIDAYTFPNFAWLAERSTWYRNATGVTQWTRDAFPSMLTGRWPSKAVHLGPESDRRDPAVAANYRNYPANLFTLLSGPYQLDVHETATRLCPPQACAGDAGRAASPATRAPADDPREGGLLAALRRSGALLGELVSPSDTASQETSPDIQEPATQTVTNTSGRKVKRPAAFSAFLAGLRPLNLPTLHYIHLVLPHRPWRWLPDGLQYPWLARTYGIPAPGALWEAEPTWARLGRQRHWLQLAFADRLLGETLATLRQRGLLDQAVVVVTADHGISFAPGTAARIIGRGNQPWIMWVPLFIKEPGQTRGRIDDRNWEHVDLLPTLADYARVTVPWPVDGRSALRGQPRTETTKRFVAVRENQPPKVFTVDGPPNLAAALRGWLPAHPDARPVLGGEPGRGLYRLGPRPDLVGRPLDRLRVTAGGPAVTVEDLAAFREVRLDRGEVPAYLHGTVPAGLPPGTLLAVALNGRVGAVATVAVEGRDHRLRFAAMLPGSWFVVGANRLEVLAVEGGQLRRLPLQGG